MITDSTGAKAQALTYYPYGDIRTNQSFTTPAVDVPYKYTGQAFDYSTDFYYYESRYQDPWFGRFISPDTLVPDPLNPQDLNRYSYVRNSPPNYIDPTGLCSWNLFRNDPDFCWPDWSTRTGNDCHCGNMLGIRLTFPLFGVVNS
ncbi:MAG: RHS repeat-associated core domain-containing protein [Nitrospira sp.]|nr:RHS repeat-associated core domain-containing protein [Nitrospira sp.]